MAQPDVPAVIVEPGADSRAELLRVVTTALRRSDVTLADAALTQDSVLIVERTVARDPTGQRLSGRDTERPEQFQLVTASGKCVLIHQRSAQRYALTQTRCVRAE